MKMLRTQAIEDGAIPANDDKPQLSKAWNETANLVAKLPGAPSKERFQITWFDDVDQSTAKEEILQGVLKAGEFSLFVAKPGTGKSVLVGDIGCHIAAGMDWHGHGR
jgi:RecA-family ATPase